MKKEIRNSNLELLRIISMILIMFHHYAIHGFLPVSFRFTMNKLILDFLSLGGQLGVSCFVLISGYFMLDSKFTLQKLFKIVGEVLFYSIGIGCLFFFFLEPVEPLGLFNLLQTFFPIGYVSYWFITNYLLLMILSPFLNRIIKEMDQKTHRNFILVSIFLWSFLAVFFGASFEFNKLGWFIVLYFIAGYVKKYVDLKKQNANKHFYMALFFYILLMLTDVSLLCLGNFFKKDILINSSNYFMKINSPFILFIAIFLFVGFIKRKPFQSKLINKISSTTLGIYLIHDNRILRPYLWRNIVKAPTFYSSHFLIFHAIFSIFLIFLFCVLIDLIRQVTFEKYYVIFLNHHLQNFKQKIKLLGNQIEKLLKKFVMWYY